MTTRTSDFFGVNPTKWETITANTDAELSVGYFVDTTAGAITLTFPASPNIGSHIEITDVESNFETNNLTIGRNNKLIMGVADDMTLNVDGQSLKFVYSGSTNGWTVALDNVENLGSSAKISDSDFSSSTWNGDTENTLSKNVFRDLFIDERLASPNKNLLINGDFKIWQKDTTAPSYGGQKSADMWYSDSNCKMNRIYYTSTLYGARLYCSTSSGEYMTTKHGIHNQDCQMHNGDTFTLSYEVKGSHNSIETYTRIQSGTITTDGSPTTISNKGYDDVYNGTWRTIVHTFTLSANIPSSEHMYVRLTLRRLGTSGFVGNYVEIRNFKLEKGSHQTPNKPTSYRQAFDECSRFLQYVTNPTDVYNPGLFSGAHQLGKFFFPIRLPIRMFKVPTFHISSYTHFWGYPGGANATGSAIIALHPLGGTVTVDWSGRSEYDGMCMAHAHTDAYMYFEAIL